MGLASLPILKCQHSFRKRLINSFIPPKAEKTVIRMNDVQPGSIVFYDAIVLPGTPGINQTDKEVRVVGYRVAGIDYWIATDRHDLTAEQMGFAYKLRGNLEIFFGWWKCHLKVYHLISRSQYGYINHQTRINHMQNPNRTLLILS